ncbi:MAG: flippase-like domain-containing protein [Blastocatellia bacterium]|nr:flippase-like domain-containing protein [Blastocatellia bacterium]
MSRKFKSILVLALGLGLAYWFINGLDWESVWTNLLSARIWPLVLAAVLIDLTMVARSLRWQAFLEPIKPVGLANLFAATTIGFGGLFVIGRAGSEIIRPTFLSLRERLRPSATLATILVERIYDSATVGLLFSLNLLFFKLPAERAASWERIGGTRMFGGVLTTLLLLGLIALVLLRLRAELLIGWLKRVTERMPQKYAQPLLNFVSHLADGLTVLLDLRKLAITIFYTACVWLLVSVATWLTLFAFGINFSPSQIIFTLGFGLIGSLVPTPGGSAGAFHAAAAKGFQFLGLEQNLAASIAIVYHLIAFGPPFILALYYLARADISFDQVREMIASEGEAIDLKGPVS